MDFQALGAQKYVSVTSFRRNGTRVATPVWIVQDGNAVAFCTQSSLGKVKHIPTRN